jgi:uncharacterized protein YndB with AHSA1/START domain
VADRVVSASTDVDAPPSAVFELLADPAQHARIDGGGTVVGTASVRGPRRLSLGARFGMRMRLGLPYTVRNTVSEFEEGRRIAWHHPARAVWRWELEPLATGGTRVTESFDWSRSPLARGIELTGFPERNRAAIRASLQRVKEIVES